MVGTSANGEVSSGIFAATELTGNAGDLNVTTEQLIIRDGAEISANSEGEGSGGNLFLRVNSLTLSNQASILASTESGEGGNVILQVDDNLMLRNNSLISAEATNSANGGNLTIDTDLIVAFPNQNNDIIANAEQGNGGNINITTEALFGIEERPLNPFTNDINASSEFGLQGGVSINTPDVDPTSSLIELPQAVGDPSDQISQNPCQQGAGSEFIITGKGGLPPNPNENLNSDAVQVDLVEPLPQPLSLGQRSLASYADARSDRSYKERGARVGANAIHPTNITPEDSTSEVVPAMGWVFNNKGEVTLTAYNPTNTGIQRSRQENHNTCSSRIAP